MTTGHGVFHSREYDEALAFGEWARGPQGANAIRTILSANTTTNEAWLCLRAAFHAGATINAGDGGKASKGDDAPLRALTQRQEPSGASSRIADELRDPSTAPDPATNPNPSGQVSQPSAAGERLAAAVGPEGAGPDQRTAESGDASEGKPEGCAETRNTGMRGPVAAPTETAASDRAASPPHQCHVQGRDDVVALLREARADIAWLGGQAGSPRAELLKRIDAALAGHAQGRTPVCDHEWVSADNEVVKGASICRKCKTIVATDTLPAICTVQPAEVRLDDKGRLDEVCGSGVDAHLECLDGGHWFLCIGDVAVWLHSRKGIAVSYERRSITARPDPVVGGSTPSAAGNVNGRTPVATPEGRALNTVPLADVLRKIRTVADFKGDDNQMELMGRLETIYGAVDGLLGCDLLVQTGATVPSMSSSEDGELMGLGLLFLEAVPGCAPSDAPANAVPLTREQSLLVGRALRMFARRPKSSPSPCHSEKPK